MKAGPGTGLASSGFRDRQSGANVAVLYKDDKLLRYFTAIFENFWYDPTEFTEDKIKARNH